MSGLVADVSPNVLKPFFGRTQDYFKPRVCVQSCTGLNQRACGESARAGEVVDTAPLCIDVSTSARHCGACGFACPIGSFCSAGLCQCTTASCALTKGFCDRTANTSCATCSAGFANCVATGDSGIAADCETNTGNNPANCGSCSNNCNSGFGLVSGVSGHTCILGGCRCGINVGRCPPSAPFCDGTGNCVECNPAARSTLCEAGQKNQRNTFCSASTKTCEQCPLGFADCAGTDGTCETQIYTSGQVSNCGKCGVSCSAHEKMSCCNGACKCGNFVNRNIPNVFECIAASTCGVSEYCDDVYGKCLPLPDQVRKANCNGNAGTPNSASLVSVSVYPFCGSCEVFGSRNGFQPTTGKCTLFDNNLCGLNEANAIKCSSTMTCFKGTCVPSQFVATSNPLALETLSMSWAPSALLKLSSSLEIPANGCFNRLDTNALAGWTDRMIRYVGGFYECAIVRAAANGALPANWITLEDFANPSFRASVCTGTSAHTCAPSFCTALFNNATKYKPQFCNAMDKTMSTLRRCARNLKLHGNETLPESIVDDLAINLCSRIDTSRITEMEIAAFMGCDRYTKGGVVYNASLPIGGGVAGTVINAFPTRREACRKYLSGNAAGKMLLSLAASVTVMGAMAAVIWV